MKLTIKPEAEALGLTTNDLARQTREAFFGAEAQRIQRGREDVRVMVRYPKDSRSSISQLERMRIRTPDGAEVPFSAVANAEIGPGFTSIRRIDRNRSIDITADANKEKVNMGAVTERLKKELPGIVADYPGMHHSFEGEAREQADAFRSPFHRRGLCGFLDLHAFGDPAEILHAAFHCDVCHSLRACRSNRGTHDHGASAQYHQSFGLLALAGVVVNDSLVMVDYINGKRTEGMGLHEAVISAGRARFRAIMLTSVTTFRRLDADDV